MWKVGLVSRATRLSLLKLLDVASEKLDELAENADKLADDYHRILIEEGSRLGEDVYEAIYECMTYASNRLYGGAVRLALRKAHLLATFASKSPTDFMREAWRAYIEIALPKIPLELLPEKPVKIKVYPGHARILAQILHAAYLINGAWEARFASILIYAISLADKLKQEELVELLLLAPASYRAHENGDREWSLALLGWPLRRALHFSRMVEERPPIEHPWLWSSLIMASYLRDIAIPMNQEVLYKWGLHKAIMEPREESY